MEPRAGPAPAPAWTAEGLAWAAGLVLALSSFMGWYSDTGAGITVSVVGWHTGVVGQLVFFVGLAALLILGVRTAGYARTPALPTGFALAALGAAGTILVLVRLLSIPTQFQPAGRAIGIWISLAAALLLVIAGILRATDEL